MENLENTFQKELDKIISIPLEPGKTKEDILRIKKIVNSLLRNCKGEAPEEELLEDFLYEYNRELKITENIEETYALIFQYRAYKELLNRYRRNKSSFDKVVLEARKRDRIDNTEKIPIVKDLEECMIGAVRRILRKGFVSNEKMLIETVSELKSTCSQAIKRILISEMQNDIAFLDEYGFLDEYIEEANNTLRKLGLEKLSYLKRNPIPDEKYDAKRNLIKDDESIGVLDSFDTEHLEKLSVEQLTRMTGEWKEKYMEARISIAEAMATLHFLGLKDNLLKDDDSLIENLSEDEITKGLKIFKALETLYKCNNTNQIPERIEKQYKMFLDKNGIKQKNSIKDELEKIKPELKNIRVSATNAVLLQSLSVYQLYYKDAKVKSWGTIGQNNKEQEADRRVTIAIEDSDFREPLTIMLSENILLDDLEIEDISKLPKFKKTEKIDKLGGKSLYLPIDTCYKRTLKNYKNNKDDGSR